MIDNRFPESSGIELHFSSVNGLAVKDPSKNIFCSTSGSNTGGPDGAISGGVSESPLGVAPSVDPESFRDMPLMWIDQMLIDPEAEYEFHVVTFNKPSERFTVLGKDLSDVQKRIVLERFMEAIKSENVKRDINKLLLKD